ncbi:MAG: hypothetical protein JXR91_04705 [Deltaproteobacteria bacterium]|nr:hypothetical protein [Deltaproteobacteria bacterium]
MKCESCGMPIESGAYCQHCSDEHGNLQTIEERIRRMSLFMKKQNPSIDDKTARLQTIEYLKKMPAWKNHPELK